MFKVIYGWGRRTETAKLDLLDWGRNPAAEEFGRYGMLHVRYGKAVRGQPPRRRNVSSVMGWAVDAVEDYVENIRPRFGVVDHPALWVTERGGRIKPAAPPSGAGRRDGEVAGRAGAAGGATLASACRRAVTPTPTPSGNASARACRAA
jgi:hypothetical protein